MKKFTLFVIIFYTVTYTFAQLPVSQTPENKNVVLEEFTGIHCPNCPDGHRRAQLIQNAHPDDVVLINIHTGSYAVPATGEPDFRTLFGLSLENQSELAGYPAGTVNRHVFGYSQSGSSTATALGRDQWTNATNTLLSQNSYCNIALEADIDVNTRVMTVNVEVYYTADAPVSSNFINVALLQDNIEGPQSGSSYNPDQVLPNGNYNHMHMLRHLITGQWGDQVSTVSQGTLVQRQYTYTLPNDINGVDLELGNLKIAGFVAESHQEIVTGNYGVINFTGLQYNVNATVNNVETNDYICSANELEPRVKIQNTGMQPITGLTIAYNINNGPTQTYNWTGTINTMSSKTLYLPGYNFNIEPTNTLTVDITSVNGNPDENNSDDTQSVNFHKTNNQGQGSDYVVVIVQDQFGDETSWAITDDMGNIITTGGPYSQLSSSGTQTHTHSVTLSQGCYNFYVFDSYGDGMCCEYGNGAYRLEQSDGSVVLQGDGQFTSQVKQSFGVDMTGAVDEQTVFDNLNLYPNPSTGTVYIHNDDGMQLKIYNENGSLVFQKDNLLSNENIQLNLPNGIYMAKFIKNDKTIIKKIVISN